VRYKIYIFLIIMISLIFLVACNDTTNNSLINNDDQGEASGEFINLSPKDYERYNSDGELTMGIIFADPLGEGKDGYLSFVVAIDNHSYDLNEYDLSDYATLVNDKGESPEGKPKWELFSGGGHHVINYLLFPDDGFITADTKYIKLVINDFIDIPVREFVWEKEFLGIKE